MILPVQPRPYLTQMGYLRIGLHIVTGITRRWREGETSRCRLCPPGACSAYKNVCTVQVGYMVPRGQGALFSGVGLDWQAPGVPLGLVVDDDTSARRGEPVIGQDTGEASPELLVEDDGRVSVKFEHDPTLQRDD